MYQKYVCIVKKTGFMKKGRNFTLVTRFSIEENSIMYRKPGCIVKKTPFLQGKTEILQRKQELL